MMTDSDTLYRLLFTLAPSGVVFTDRAGRILEFNERAYEQLGYTREEFSNLSIADLDADETADEISAKFGLLEEQGFAEFEVRHRTKSGAIRNVLVRSRPVDVAGERRFLAVWQDITERKRTEDALRQSEALLRAFSDAIPDPVFLKDRSSRFLFANPAALAVLGKPLERVLGKTDVEIYEDRATGEMLVEIDRRIMESGVPEVVEEQIRTSCWTRVFLTTKVPYRDAAGNVIGIIGNARDITDRNQAELALRDREDRLRQTLKYASAGTWEWNVVSGEKIWSPETYALFGLDPRYTQASPRRWEESVHPDDLPAAKAAIRDAIEARTPEYHSEYRVRHPVIGERWILGVGRVERAPDGSAQRMLGLHLDITDRKRAEEQATQAQKMESVGRLAGGIAHDFNNLLTVILSCADAMHNEVARLPACVEALEDIRVAGMRARDLTRQLLAFSRRQLVEAVPLSLNTVVRGTEKLLRRVLGEDIDLVCSLPPDLWTTRCDPGQIEQVIMNLAVNARDAMPNGGRLTLETRNSAGSTSCGSDHVSLVIGDSGVGMSSDVKAHLFEPFFTTKPRGQGTGLGLATVYGIVKQCNGQIRVESELGRGTTFEICLPRVLDEPLLVEPQQSVARAGGPETLLVVEDDALVRGVTVRVLRSGGYRVLVAGSGREALALPAQELRGARLLITDVVMPGVAGPAMADELRARYPGLRVLFVSGYSEDAIAHRGAFARGIDFLPKPFSATALLARVRSILDAA
jgi:PAS domain S-box-containing protein